MSVTTTSLAIASLAILAEKDILKKFARTKNAKSKFVKRDTPEAAGFTVNLEGANLENTADLNIQKIVDILEMTEKLKIVKIF